MSRLGRVFREEEAKEEFLTEVERIRKKYMTQFRTSKEGAIGWALDALDDVSKIPIQLAARHSKET